MQYAIFLSIWIKTSCSNPLDLHVRGEFERVSAMSERRLRITHIEIIKFEKPVMIFNTKDLISGCAVNCQRINFERADLEPKSTLSLLPHKITSLTHACIFCAHSARPSRRVNFSIDYDTKEYLKSSSSAWEISLNFCQPSAPDLLNSEFLQQQIIIELWGMSRTNLLSNICIFN